MLYEIIAIKDKENGNKRLIDLTFLVHNLKIKMLLKVNAMTDIKWN